MDSLQEILANHRFDAPDEVKAIKNYLKVRYNSDSRIRSDASTVFVSVPSSALAATLQLERDKISRACKIKKRLVIRVGR